MKSEYVEPLINERTKAIVPVHLYGQSCEMQDLVNLAKYELFVVEDNAQAIGCKYHFNDGTKNLLEQLVISEPLHFILQKT